MTSPRVAQRRCKCDVSPRRPLVPPALVPPASLPPVLREASGAAQVVGRVWAARRGAGEGRRGRAMVAPATADARLPHLL